MAKAILIAFQVATIKYYFSLSIKNASKYSKQS